MGSRPVGAADIEIRPSLGSFETQLRSQLQPIVARVEQQLGPAFARAGQQAGEAFTSNFQRTVGTRLGAAVQGAVSGREISNAGRQAMDQFGRGVEAQVQPAVTKRLSDGIEKATAATSRQVQAAGEQSGRTFGSGFGEGFAALAAFAIAARVGQFFRQTVTEAGEFADAFAGVRKNVDGSQAQFSRFEGQIKTMAEQFGRTAPEIAGVAEEAAKLGTPIANLATVTQTAVKAGIALDISAQEAATGLTTFARKTDTPLVQVSNIASAVAELDANFATTAPRILEFADRAAAGLNRLGLTGPEILGISAAFSEAGVRVDSGSRAIITAIGTMQRAAASGGKELQALLGVTKLSEDQFKALAQTDPAALFVRFLKGISTAGANLEPVLSEIGLDAQRLSQNLGVGANQFDRIAQAITQANTAFDANTRLNRELAIRQESSADRLRRLEEAFRNTRIEIGSKLAPVLTRILGPFSQLSTGTVELAAAFAGLAAGGFAFLRFSNIIREFQRTLGGGALTAEEFAAGMRVATTQGATLAQVTRIAARERQTLLQVEQQLAAGNANLARQFADTNRQTIGFFGAFRQARGEIQQFGVIQTAAAASAAQVSRAAAEQGIAIRGAASSVASANVAMRVAGSGSQALADALLLQSRSATSAAGGLAAAGRAAFTAAGGFGALAGALGKISIIALIADFATQAIRGLENFFLTLGAGEQDVEATTAEIQKLVTGIGDVGSVIEKAGIDFSALQAADIPVLRDAANASQEVLNRIPLIGRIINTESENATRSLAGLNEALINLLEGTDPRTAEAVFKIITNQLKEQGAAQDLVAAGLSEFTDRLGTAKESSKAMAVDAGKAKETLAEMGVTGEDAARALQFVGIAGDEAAGGLASIIGASEAAANALQRLQGAQSDFQNRVQGLIQPVSGLIAAQKALAKSGSGAGRDTLRSARAIADAERALAEAREDAARRIAEAQRRVSEAEIDAARKVVDAQRRLEESRLNSRRSLRDAGEALSDFQDALQRVGGALTPEDVIRLRDLQQAAADASEDATNREIEGQRQLFEAQRDGAEAIAEAQRKLAEAQEEAAERIEEALLRLARAHEDAANRSSAAAAKTAEAVKLSTAQMVQGFRDQAAQLNTFATLMDTVANRVFAAFGDRDLAEAFLADLNEMGIESIPILQNLVRSSDTTLAGIGDAFESQIKAAKKAADFQFKRFPPNFKQAIAPAIDNIIIELERGITVFDGLEDKSGDIATAIGTDLQNLTIEFSKLASEAGGSLNPVVLSMLQLANNAVDSIDRVQILKDLINGIKGGTIPLTVDFSADTRRLEKQFQEAIQRLIKKGAETGGLFGSKFGSTISGAPLPRLPRAQFGATFPVGTPLLVGKHTAEELFIPNTAGAIFRHSDTERILRALRAPRQSVTQQNITVNEVAQSPEATARAISFLLGSNGAVR